jgi:hypothetical protein
MSNFAPFITMMSSMLHRVNNYEDDKKRTEPFTEFESYFFTAFFIVMLCAIVAFGISIIILSIF